MPTCAAVGCTVTENIAAAEKLSFFRFPKQPVDRKIAWVNAVKRKNWTPTSNSRLCSRHFITGKPSNDPNHPDWKPSIFEHTLKSVTSARVNRAIQRYERNRSRRSEVIGRNNNLSEIVGSSSASNEINDKESLPKNSQQDEQSLEMAVSVSHDPSNASALEDATFLLSLDDTQLEEHNIWEDPSDGGTLYEESGSKEPGLSNESTSQHIINNCQCPGFQSQLETVMEQNKANMEEIQQLRKQLEEASNLIQQRDMLIESMSGQLREASETISELKTREETDRKAHELEIESLRTKNIFLERKLTTECSIGFNFVNFDSDDQIKFFTGIPNAKLFKRFLQYVCNYYDLKTECSLSNDNQMLLTLMELRLGLTNQDLAYRFQVPRTTVSKVFLKWLDALAVECQKLIFWPDRKTLKKHLPESFRNETFKDTVVIIDCSEVFIERPSSLAARGQTYSNYKNHNTLKFLIGVTPSGAICFLSKCHGGRISDKQITMESGILDKLEPGDLLLADRGFFYI